MTFLNILTFFYAFEIGAIPNGAFSGFEYGAVEQKIMQEYQYYGTMFYNKFQMQIDITKYLFIAGDIRTDMNKRKYNHTFAPTLTDYGFVAGSQIKTEKIAIKLQYEHRCTHPVTTYFITKGTTFYQGYYDAISIKLSNY